MGAPDRPDGREARQRFPFLACARAMGGAWLLGLLVVLLAASAAVRAEERIVVARASVDVRHGADPGTFVDAQFDVELPLSLREAVDHGIALYFVIELEVLRSRWYWFDKRLLDESIEYRLSFSPLTRQYRLARGGLAQPFDSLDQALATMRRVTQWRVADARLFDGGKTQARIRLRLDTSMLPKPFQVSALTDRDWTLASDWTGLALTIDRPN
ncbi:conserved exported hypothetical protein [Burkholderiales bacterium]|nr:conserved exported hypothetical protein [Burkholderiales bacterium]